MATNPNTAHLSAHPSYWRSTQPPKLAGSAVRNRSRQDCPKCGRDFTANGIALHLRICTREAPIVPVNAGAGVCIRCGGPSKFADVCWPCEVKVERFEELDSLGANRAGFKRKDDVPRCPKCESSYLAGFGSSPLTKKRCRSCGHIWAIAEVKL